MSKSYTYFSIPYDLVPKQAGFTVWFATWSTTRPQVPPGVRPPFAIGVVATGETLPAGAVELGTGSKDPIPPPALPDPAFATIADYQQSLAAWLELSREA